MPASIGTEQHMGQMELENTKETQRNRKNVRQTPTTKTCDGHEKENTPEANTIYEQQRTGKFPEVRRRKNTECGSTNHASRVRCNGNDDTRYTTTSKRKKHGADYRSYGKRQKKMVHTYGSGIT